jgi:uncharacterized Ntn-hydrolase superfamily protein
MRAGVPAPEALQQLIEQDTGRDTRQVAMIDSSGRVAAHTGRSAIVAAGHRIGREYAVQANMMENDKVWPAMAAAFEGTKGDLAERLLAALDAGQAAGGDIRGKQSAALLIVTGVSSGRPWSGADRVFDLRVDDHPEPIVELRRLVRLQRAYLHANRGDELLTSGRADEAAREYALAGQLAPEVLELPFWQAVTLATIGRETEASAIFKDIFARQPFWADLLQRLPAAGLFPSDPTLMERLQRLRPPRSLR